MSIFGNIMSAIFGTATAKAESGQNNSTSSSGTAASSSGAAGARTASGASSVDVAAVLTQRAATKKEKLNWRTSIVDLMKVLDLDSSLTARKELAKELNYTGSTDDSAAMNMWLHKEVMAKFAANGGKVPDDLKN
jgi:hypothetical protein